MKVYRGPSTKDFSDDSHELVATADISNSLASWHDSVLLKVNVTKAPTERQAVAHLQLESGDVMALHTQLINGLMARSMALDDAQARMKRAAQHTYELYEYVRRLAPEEGEDGYYGVFQTIMDMLSPIATEVNP